MTRRLSLGVSGVISLFLIAPTLIVVPLSFSSASFLSFPPPGWSLQWYDRFFSTPDWIDAAVRSLQVGLMVTVLATVLGTLAALGLTRRRMRGSALANAILVTPMVVPLIVYAIGAYAVFIQFGLVGTLTGLVIAHTVLAIPFVVINVAAPLRTLDRNLERAARSLGASSGTALRTVVLPQIAPGVLAGALFSFLTSFDEIVVALFVTTPDTKTLPVQMWSSIRLELDPTIAAAATMLIVVTSLAIAIAGLLRRGEPQS
jgi:putative spermidine/putrescine transport system permease protein